MWRRKSSDVAPKGSIRAKSTTKLVRVSDRGRSRRTFPCSHPDGDPRQLSIDHKVTTRLPEHHSSQWESSKFLMIVSPPGHPSSDLNRIHTLTRLYRSPASYIARDSFPLCFSATAKYRRSCRYAWPDAHALVSKRLSTNHWLSHSQKEI